MELSEAIRRRRTVRRFDPDRSVDDGIVADLVDAGLRTGSAGHTQAVDLLVLTAPRERAAYWELTAPPPDPAGPPNRWLAGMSAAPLLILVWTSETAYRARYAEPDKGWAPESTNWSAPYWWVDAGLAVQNLLLTATAHRLGSAFVGVPPDRQAAVATRFGVPDDRRSVGLVAVGHPDPARRPSTPRAPRRPRAERVHHGGW